MKGEKTDDDSIQGKDKPKKKKKKKKENYS